MNPVILGLAIATLFLSTLAPPVSAQESSAENERRVAVTIDDLPTPSVDTTQANKADITRKILAHLRQAKAPAAAFVIGAKLFRDTTLDERALSLLREWLHAGVELGNHSFSHASLNDLPLSVYEEDVLRADRILRPFLASEGRPLRFYRHPFLQTGRSLAVRDSFSVFLAAQGYRVAPVTLDNSEWVYARAFEKAFMRGDSAMSRRLLDAYIPYMEAKCAYDERLSQALFGRQIRQILLIHANRLNAEGLDRLLEMFRGRGYAFIPLSEALKDSAYASPDTFTGRGGISWLDRWALTAGKPDRSFLQQEPRVPAWVMSEAGVTSE